MSYIVNAAPMVIERGTQDLSARSLPREAEQVPIHCPKWYLYAQKGPTTPQLVTAANRVSLFGAKTFDMKSKFANYSTVFANAMAAEGNASMVQRIIPSDAGPE